MLFLNKKLLKYNKIQLQKKPKFSKNTQKYHNLSALSKNILF